MAKNVKLEQPDWNDSQVKTDLARMEAIFRTGGYDPVEKKQISMKDALDIPNAAFLIPRVLTTFVQEGIEPMLIGTSLLQRVDYVPGMQTVFPAIDVLTAREVGDGMALPIFNINIGGAQTFGVHVTRHGLALRISERFVEQSTYPWIQYWMRLAGNALARHKEEFIFNFITQLGTVIFDNDPSARTTGSVQQPVKGITTGRNLKGQFNGSMTADDVFDMYAQILTQGFIPDVMLIHPMSWLQWVKDPVLREFAIQNGGGSYFAQWTGQANELSKPFFNFGALGFGQGQTGQFTAGALTGGQTSTAAGLPQTQKSGPVLPNYLGLPFRIVVSPFMKFDPVNRLVDTVIFNSTNLGALIVDQDPHVNSWDDPMYDLRNISIEESYGLALINEGQAIGTAKNIKLRPNEIVLPARSIMDIGVAQAAGTFQTYENTQVFGASPVDPTLVALSDLPTTD
jgi:hypothetical protein